MLNVKYSMHSHFFSLPVLLHVSHVSNSQPFQCFTCTSPFPELRRPIPIPNSNISTSMADSDNGSGRHNAGGDFSVREQDKFLPIANVSRIMKKALPENAKISKNAKETVQECVSKKDGSSRV